MNQPGDVRCPSCARLLAKVLPDGSWEVRYGTKERCIIRDGSVFCVPCTVGVPTHTVDGEPDTPRRPGATWGR